MPEVMERVAPHTKCLQAMTPGSGDALQLEATVAACTSAAACTHEQRNTPMSTLDPLPFDSRSNVGEQRILRDGWNWKRPRLCSAITSAVGSLRWTQRAGLGGVRPRRSDVFENLVDV